jgi:hypothetical protein
MGELKMKRWEVGENMEGLAEKSGLDCKVS